MARYTNFPNGITSFGHPVGPNTQGLTGDAFFVVPSANSSTSYFNDWATQRLPKGKVFTSVAAAYAATTTGRNDTVYVFPGTYTVTSALSWAKHHTHLVGLGGPGYYGVDSYAPNVLMECTTAAVAEVVDFAGHNCQCWNMSFSNRAADAGNLCAVEVTSYGNYFNNCYFNGLMATTQVATAAAAALYIGNAGLSMFERCHIGQDVWSIRTGSDQGCIRFTSTSRPNNITFKDCQIKSHSKTAACAMVAVPAATSTGRNILFDNCIFTNFADDGTSINQAFHTTASGQKHSILLHNCSAFGIDEWQDDNLDMVIGTMPITGTGGGLHIEQTGVAGA